MKKMIITAILACAVASPAWASVNVVKVCNYRVETVWASYAVQSGDNFLSNGWYEMQPSGCVDLLFDYSGLFKLFAYSSSGWSPSFEFDRVVSPTNVCVRRPVWHENLDQRVCVDAPAGSEYHFESGHIFDFINNDFNVYEIGMYNG